VPDAPEIHHTTRAPHFTTVSYNTPGSSVYLKTYDDLEDSSLLHLPPEPFYGAPKMPSQSYEVPKQDYGLPEIPPHYELPPHLGDPASLYNAPQRPQDNHPSSGYLSPNVESIIGKLYSQPQPVHDIDHKPPASHGRNPINLDFHHLFEAVKKHLDYSPEPSDQSQIKSLPDLSNKYHHPSQRQDDNKNHVKSLPDIASNPYKFNGFPIEHTPPGNIFSLESN